MNTKRLWAAIEKNFFFDTPLKSGEDTTYPDLLEKQDAITRDEQVIK